MDNTMMNPLMGKQMPPMMQGIMGQGMPNMPMQQGRNMKRGSGLQQAMKRRLAGLRKR